VNERGKYDMNKRIKITSANIFFMIFTFIFIIAQIVLGIIVSLGYGEKIINNVYLTIFVTEIFLILIPSVIFTLINKLDIREVFRLRRLRLKPALIIILMSLPAYIVASMFNSIVLFFLQFIGKIPANIIPTPTTIQELLIGILIVGVLPGLCEEVLNRGIMLNAYENRGTMKAVIITGLFFGIFHFDITNFFGPAVLGALLGYYAIRTNSILAPMLAHFLNNTIAEILSYVYRNEPVTEFIQVNGAELFAVILAGLIGIFVIYWLLRLFTKKTSQTAVIHPPISDCRQDTKAILTHYPIIIVLVIYALLTLLYLSIIIFPVV